MVALKRGGGAMGSNTGSLDKSPHESNTGAGAATEDPEVIDLHANPDAARRSWREDGRLRNPTSGFQRSAAIEEEDEGVETKERPGGRRNPGDRGAVCPNRGQEECEESDGGCPDQGRKKYQTPGSRIH
ncbi:hypothetical protein NDU88_006916 [Pleurodeles waltl]|uniref:Uncharacterized protein n=1 Tax=Pleurodeles waltl TaxID=8319 RepID=A0AAV7RQU6_PLEWA|nr:hypothetical protein NDU88_006916 [Pleurodeles waltl]